MTEWRLSAGTAGLIGLKKLRMEAMPTTAYIMLGTRCANDCKFCAQGRSASGRVDLLSRVTWPFFLSKEVIEAVGEACRQETIQRICLQVVAGENSWQNIREALVRLKSVSSVPISVSSCITEVNQAYELVKCGASRVGIALDGAAKEVFETAKGSSWNLRWKLLSECAKELPEKISTHLIVGLGETEQEMVECIAACLAQKITVGLFAFTPIRGTLWEKKVPPSISRYRRMQAAHFLLKQGYSRDIFSFCNGKLVEVDLSYKELHEALATGKAFETTGCTGCNRPYYNERPGGVMYNYPCRLSLGALQQAINECELKIGGSYEVAGC